MARAIAIIAAASMTHDNGFHINPKNFKILLSCIQDNITEKRKLDVKTTIKKNQSDNKKLNLAAIKNNSTRSPISEKESSFYAPKPTIHENILQQDYR